jgi:asparagine synthase (glutamine-hydrolysing)
VCGIIGITGPQERVSGERFIAARDLMCHRGPDDAGSHTIGCARFGARRLAIIDLSPAGHQPMVSDDGRVMLVFNGEIYNFSALRRELERCSAFRSRSDTEVLLHGYIHWGWDALLRRIDGMFAFAVWDDRTHTLYAARDRTGKKPLYYARLGGGLVFASTLNALRPLLPDRPAVDPVALDAYLTYQAVPAPLTLFQGISQLPPAHQLVFDLPTGRLDITRYWDVRYAPKLRRSEAEVLDELDHLIRSAVRRRLESDVPLGAFLSGGVDSSLVVAMMAQEMRTPVEAVVIGFDDPTYDERPYARCVARRWGVRLHEHVIQSTAITALPEIIWQYGQPLADVSIVPTDAAARAAKQHVTVVLNGDGGDELFGGYARPVVARAAQAYRRSLPAAARRLIASGLAGRDRGPLRRAAMLARAGAGEAADAFVYDRAFRAYRTRAYTDAFKQSLAGRHPDSLYRSVWERADGADDVDRALYGDFATYLSDQLLTKMDVSTMAHSVEGRSPLLDTALVEFAARIPTNLRLRNFQTKYLLKRLAERYVPREVLYRRKRGFVMPAGDWLRGELAPYVRATLLSQSFRERDWIRPGFAARMVGEHLAGTRNWGEQLWTLFVLEVWARMTLDGTLHRTDTLEALR